MNNILLLSTLGNDPHTEGLHKVKRIADKLGIHTVILPPADDVAALIQSIKSIKPQFLGISYRLSPEIGIDLFRRLMSELSKHGLVGKKCSGELRLGFAGLPKTISAFSEISRSFESPVFLFSQTRTAMENVQMVLDFLSVKGTRGQKVWEELRQELEPPGIKELDAIAEYVVKSDYHKEAPLVAPSQRGQDSLRIRALESSFPLIRSHFGIPSASIQPTIDGIIKLAEAGAVDEVSLGSSDLSQRYYGKAEEFEKRKNDGGVPYKDKNELRLLYLATRRGNFPAIKPYAHVSAIESFIDDCVEVGMLKGAHQAIPLFWFNELDGRGETQLEDSIREHIRAVKKLAALGIPVEMNDPNQWSSRWAHDTVIAADYGLISAVMANAGVQEMIFQFQFNKPSETGDFADLAKMTAGLELIRKITDTVQNKPLILRETRTGIEHLSPVPEKARIQLARSTLLQMMISPQIIHLVSYCEADHAATPEDVIESSKIVRRAVRLFRENQPDLQKYLNCDIVSERRKYLVEEASYLLRQIQILGDPLLSIDSTLDYRSLADPESIIKAIKERYMTAPGIVHPKYKCERMITKPGKYGFFDVVDFEDNSRIIGEAERLSQIALQDRSE